MRLRRLSVLPAALGLALLSGCGDAGGTASVDRTTLQELSSRPHRPCPHTDRAFRGSPDPATRHTLVPGDPIAVLICRYRGDREAPDPLTLAGRRHVEDARRVQRLARALDALGASPPLLSCPAFGGRSMLLLFQYERDPDAPVRIVREGCVEVDNGHIADTYLATPTLGVRWPDEGLI